MSVVILSILGSLVLLVAGAEGLVRGSASLALRLGVRPLVVGLTVVAFGTSTPELATSIKAAMAGQADIAVGNVIGSNIFNICVILGISALICPMTVRVQLVRIDTPLCVGVSIVMWLLLLDGRLSRLEGALCLVALVAYGVLNVVLARRESADEAVQDFETGIPGRKSNPVLAVLWVMGGLGLLLVGSSLLLANAVTLARALGVGEAVIGLTLVAAGTSLPELATSMLAAARNQPDLAIGNVVGSNLFNLLGILGCTAVISPIAAPGISPLDLGMLAATAMGLQGLLWTELRLQRWEGAALVGLYGFYLWWLWPP